MRVSRIHENSETSDADDDEGRPFRVRKEERGKVVRVRRQRDGRPDNHRLHFHDTRDVDSSLLSIPRFPCAIVRSKCDSWTGTSASLPCHDLHAFQLRGNLLSCMQKKIIFACTTRTAFR